MKDQDSSFMRTALLLITLLVTGKGLAQETLIAGVSNAQFRYDSSRTYIEFYTAVDPAALGFTLKNSKESGETAPFYETLVELRYAIHYLNGDSIWTQIDSLPVAVADTSSFRSPGDVVGVSKMLLRPGNYEVKLLAYATNDGSALDSARFGLEVRNFPETELCISDIELCSTISRSDQPGDPYAKNTLHVVPNPKALSGVGMPRMPYYLEIYGLSDSSSATHYEVSWRLKDPYGKIVKSRSTSNRGKSPDVVTVGEVDVSDVPSGKYILLVDVNDVYGDKSASRDCPFFVYNPYVAPQVSSDTSSVEILASPFHSMTEGQINDEFSAAKFLATPQDNELFQRLTTVDAKRRFMVSFWKRQNDLAGPGGLNTRANFTERVKFVNDKYGTPYRKGWLTDRGRVYLENGKPDEIERRPSSGSAKPYETWKYNALQGGVVFVFVDFSGFNNYVLVHSTKQGEVDDPDWQKYVETQQ